MKTVDGAFLTLAMFFSLQSRAENDEINCTLQRGIQVSEKKMSLNDSSKTKFLMSDHLSDAEGYTRYDFEFNRSQNKFSLITEKTTTQGQLKNGENAEWELFDPILEAYQKVSCRRTGKPISEPAQFASCKLAFFKNTIDKNSPDSHSYPTRSGSLEEMSDLLIFGDETGHSDSVYTTLFKANFADIILGHNSDHVIDRVQVPFSARSHFSIQTPTATGFYVFECLAD
jgi:hypothetical protein